jgi:murein L,D-transpeptidase YafK
MSNFKIKVFKSQKRLELYKNENLYLEFPIGHGANNEGHKEVEGDHKTPEGDYEILVKNPKSSFHLSLGISYPNKLDAKVGLEKGVISQEECEQIISLLDSGKGTLWNTKLGGKVYIHGGLEESTGSRGCICMYNEDIEKLYEVIDIGTKISIYA